MHLNRKIIIASSLLILVCISVFVYFFHEQAIQMISQHHLTPKILTGTHVKPAPSKNTVGDVLKTQDEILDRHNLGTSAFDTRIRLWGKVVDQHGNPVEGAMIKAIATTLRMVKVENGYREYEILSAQSAADGTFMFDGAEGFSLTIRQLSKDGYVLPSAYQAGIRWEGVRYRFRYKSIGDVQSVFHPNPEQPVVFHLWKLHKPEPLIINGTGVGTNGPEFKLGGLPKALTMVGKTEYELKKLGLARDITIKVDNVGSVQSPEWEVTVASLESDGGVIIANPSDVFQFQAPEFGYCHSIKYRYGPEGTDAIKGEKGAPVRFYVRSKGGRWFSAVEFTFFSPNENGIVPTNKRLWTNPNGSRNLEHDAAHLLESPRLTR